MKTKTPARPAAPTEEEIQHAAYLLWIEEGRPEGCDLQHWQVAREILLQRRPDGRRIRRGAPAAAGSRRAS